jgi:hypothetical protein
LPLAAKRSNCSDATRARTCTREKRGPNNITRVDGTAHRKAYVLERSL